MPPGELPLKLFMADKGGATVEVYRLVWEGTEAQEAGATLQSLRMKQSSRPPEGGQLAGLTSRTRWPLFESRCWPGWREGLAACDWPRAQSEQRLHHGAMPQIVLAQQALQQQFRREAGSVESEEIAARFAVGPTLGPLAVF